MRIKGELHLYSETGSEGGWWAIQDENYIFEDKKSREINWSYDGLIFLKEGDYLKIFKSDDSVYWEGELHFEIEKCSTENSFGFWIHADQAGISRSFWATPFLKGYKAELLVKTNVF